MLTLGSSIHFHGLPFEAGVVAAFNNAVAEPGEEYRVIKANIGWIVAVFVDGAHEFTL